MTLCRICCSEVFKQFSLINSIKTQAVCQTLEDSLRVPMVEIGIFYCNTCDFYQVDSVDYQHYSDEDYFLSAELSETQRIYQNKFIKIMKNYLISPVLEIGPGDGYLGMLLDNAGYEYVGYEPAKKSYEQCKKKGLNIINDYFGLDQQLENKFATIIGRQVLEHIVDVEHFLKIVMHSLTNEGVAIFEVPNIDKARSLNRTIDFCPEHVNYFTINSLSRLFSSCGFNVVEIKKTYQEEYLLIVVSKRNQFKLNLQYQEFSDMVFWGAGSRGITLCHMMRAKPLYFVDSDPNKTNKFIPSTSIEILSPDHLFQDPKCKKVLITSYFYFDEVLNNLINHGYSGDILYINEHAELIRYDPHN